jgi:hypothetical protein
MIVDEWMVRMPGLFKIPIYLENLHQSSHINHLVFMSSSWSDSRLHASFLCHSTNPRVARRGSTDASPRKPDHCVCSMSHLSTIERPQLWWMVISYCYASKYKTWSWMHYQINDGDTSLFVVVIAINHEIKLIVLLQFSSVEWWARQGGRPMWRWDAPKSRLHGKDNIFASCILPYLC